MTGFISGSRRPLPRTSVAGFADLGCIVDLDQADPYHLPRGNVMAAVAVPRLVVERPTFVEIPTSPKRLTRKRDSNQGPCFPRKWDRVLS